MAGSSPAMTGGARFAVSPCQNENCGRLSVPLDIAKGILLLVSDDAGTMNGAGPVVDGGYLAA